MVSGLGPDLGFQGVHQGGGSRGQGYPSQAAVLLHPIQKLQKLTVPSADLKMRGKLGSGPRTVMVNDCDAKLKGDGSIGSITTITEKETHF